MQVGIFATARLSLVASLAGTCTKLFHKVAYTPCLPYSRLAGGFLPLDGRGVAELAVEYIQTYCTYSQPQPLRKDTCTALGSNYIKVEPQSTWDIMQFSSAKPCIGDLF